MHSRWRRDTCSSSSRNNSRGGTCTSRTEWYNSARMASPTTDDGFHEIQLNGKQLVFLFMAATVVSVVIFLCGVLVGRGVKVERTTLTSDAGTATGIQDAPPLPPPAPAQTAANNVEPAATAPPPVPEDKFSYT